MPDRGRPKLTMTRRRQQVLVEVVSAPRRLSWSELARRCQLHDHNEARRIVHDLVAMGRLPDVHRVSIFSRITRRESRV